MFLYRRAQRFTFGFNPIPPLPLLRRWQISGMAICMLVILLKGESGDLFYVCCTLRMRTVLSGTIVGYLVIQQLVGSELSHDVYSLVPVREPLKQIFGKSWEFVPTGLTLPLPPPWAKYSASVKVLN